MTVKELRIKANMKQIEFARYFGFPIRTFQDWEYEKAKCPEYLLELMIYKLKNEGIIE